MKIYMYPGYVSVVSSSAYSPKLFGLIKSLGVELEPAYWNGSLESLPTEPCLVRASSKLPYTWWELAKKCKQLGHFCFYDDAVINDNGESNHEDLLLRAKEFFARCGIGS